LAVLPFCSGGGVEEGRIPSGGWEVDQNVPHREQEYQMLHFLLMKHYLLLQIELYLVHHDLNDHVYHDHLFFLHIHHKLFVFLVLLNIFLNLNMIHKQHIRTGDNDDDDW
jgi:hypothetical protein